MRRRRYRNVGMAGVQQWRAGPRGRRTSGWFAAGLVAAGVLAGCSAPPGSAAVVGGYSISDDALQQRTVEVLAQNPSTTGTADAVISTTNRRQVTGAIRHQLIQRAAAATGTTVSDQDVNALVAKSGEKALATQLAVPVADARSAAQDVLTVEKMVGALPTAGAQFADLDVTYDVMSATDRTDAVNRRARYLADPNAMDTDIAAHPDTGKLGGHEAASDNTGDGAYGVFQAAVGQVLIIPSQDGYAVIRIAARTVKKAALTEQSFSSASSLSAALDLASLLLAPYAAAAGVSVNPRYGVWDPVTVQVVPGNDGL